MPTKPRRNLVRVGWCLGLSLAIVGCGKTAGPTAGANAGKNEAAAAGKSGGDLVKQLKDKNPDTRLAAVNALGEQGPAAKSAGPELAAAAKACSWEMFVLEEELVSIGSSTFFTVVGQRLGGAPETEAERKAREKANRQAEEEARKRAEKKKPVEALLHKEEILLLAVLEALEKIDPSELSNLGLDKDRLAKVKATLARRMKTSWVNPQQNFHPIGPSIQVLPPKK